MGDRERIAEALWSYWHPHLPWEEQKDNLRAEYREAASAALSAPEGETRMADVPDDCRFGMCPPGCDHEPVEQQPDQVEAAAVAMARYDGDNAFTDHDERDEGRREHYREYARAVFASRSGSVGEDQRLTPEDHRELLGLVQQELGATDEDSMWFDPDDFAQLKALEAKLCALAEPDGS